MNYNSSPYEIFNPQHLSRFQIQQMEARRNMQQKNAHYQQTAMNVCLVEVECQDVKDNGGNY